MQIPAPDVSWLFGERHTPTRDAAYALMSEVYRATDDRLRLVLVKTLESAGHVFFGRVAEVVERAGWSKLLKYFSFSHLEVEKNHQVFEDEISRTVAGDAPGAQAAHRGQAAGRSLLRRLHARCSTRCARPTPATWRRYRAACGPVAAPATHAPTRSWEFPSRPLPSVGTRPVLSLNPRRPAGCGVQRLTASAR